MITKSYSGALWLSLLSSCIACSDVSWESESVIDSVRVLGAKATPASLTPGESTRLSVLCADGTDGGTANPSCNVEIAWFGDCTNPKDNDPSHCFRKYGNWLKSVPTSLAEADLSSFEGKLSVSPEFQFTAPSNALEESVTVSEHSVRYGTSYVYYAVCDGQLYPSPGSSDTLPVSCRDRKTGKKLDQRHFVVGITTIYTYDVIRNRNPEITTVEFDGRAIEHASCATNAECNNGSECHSDGVCAPVVPTCNEINGCFWHRFALGLTDESFYVEDINGTMIHSAEKSLWTTYYTNAGETADEFTFGMAPHSPQNQASAYWRAPTYTTDQARIWFVVRYDRGGQAWQVQPIIVR